jgi:K+-transporting ATPase ATPase A chain
MEGKEVRFGITQSTLTAVVTSNGATGSTNSMHDSYTPLGGTVPLVNMLLGEIIYGGLGTGLYSIVLIALIGLLLAGLMVGRTPEYLGKKIRPPEAKMLTLYTLATPLGILPFAAIAVVTRAGLSGLTVNTGVHGFTGIVYAYASSMANNGQAFASRRPKGSPIGCRCSKPFREQLHLAADRHTKQVNDSSAADWISGGQQGKNGS